MRFAYLVDDLSRLADGELRGRAMTALAKLTAACFKHARTHADPVAMLRSWGDLFREVIAEPRGYDAVARILRYVHVVTDVDRDALLAFLEDEVGPHTKDIAVTLAERLIAEGEQKGTRQGKRELLLSLLCQRFGDAEQERVEQRLASATVEQIDAWSRRLFSAATLGELLA